VQFRGLAGEKLCTKAGEDTGRQDVFDLSWTSEDASYDGPESYRWTIDGETFTLAVRGSQLIRTEGRAIRPHVTFATSAGTLSEVVRGQMSVAHAINHRLARAKGSPEAIRRMFASIGFPLAQVGM